MSNQANNRPRLSPAEVAMSDTIQSAAAMLSGVSDALAFRAASEGDDMLAMLASVIDAQVAALRALCVRIGA